MPFQDAFDPPVAGSQIYTVLSSPAEANRAYSAVVRFEVVTPEPGVVDAWSLKRLPFEPSGWLVDFRSHLATACRSLIADQDQVLHAIYSSAVHELCDIENVLTYNLGTGAIRRAVTYGLILERSFVAERDFRHHYRYELRPGTLGWNRWTAARPLGTLHFDAPFATFTRGKAGAWWLSARRGDLSVYEPNDAVPETYLLRLTIDPPERWRGSLAGLLKPLTDGVVAAMHTHVGPTDVVAERSAAVDPRLSSAELASFLSEDRAVPLGAIRLVIPWGDTVQWNPADNHIVGLDARITRTGNPGTVVAEAHRAKPARRQ